MEKKLIQKVQNGDVQSFEELIDQNKNLVYSLVLKMVKNTEDAEEVAQDVFLKAFNSIKQFNGESKFSTWLYKIAYFTSINHLRKHKKLSSEIDLLAIESDDKSSLDKLNHNDMKKYLNEALDYLRPIDRSLISLYYLDEMTINEIEDITQLSKSNIKVKMLRIRKQLNGILTKLLNDELSQFLKN